MTVVVGSIISIVLGGLVYAITRHCLENKKEFNKLKRAWMKAEGLYYKYEDKEKQKLGGSSAVSPAGPEEDADGDGIPDAL
jgi:hypothetical protein